MGLEKKSGLFLLTQFQFVEDNGKLTGYEKDHHPVCIVMADGTTLFESTLDGLITG